MDTLRYVLGVMVVVFYPPALLYWLLIHPLAGAGVLLYGLSVALEVRTRRQLDFRTLAGVPEVSRSSWARGPGSDESADPDRPTGGSDLLTEGIYARVRHPRYLGVVLGTLGFALVVNHVGVYVLVAAFIPVLYVIVVLEERELAERFGRAYVEYAGRVPRLLLRLGRGPAGPGAGAGSREEGPEG